MLALPCLKVDGLVIWGLTHHVPDLVSLDCDAESKLGDCATVAGDGHLRSPRPGADRRPGPRRDDAGDGALCLFLGVVRNENRGRAVLRLEYEAYEEMALPLMEAIAAETRRIYPVSDVRLVHRLGRLEIGEASVAVAVSRRTGPRRSPPAASR